LNKITILYLFLILFISAVSAQAASIYSYASGVQMSEQVNNLMSQKKSSKQIKELEKLGATLIAEGETSLAQDVYQFLLSQEPSNKKIFQYTVLRGDIYVLNKNYSLALLSYEEAHNINNKNFDLEIKIGSILFENGLYNLAAQSFISALNIDKKSDFAKEKLGDIYTALEEYAQALIYYEDSKNLNENMIVNMLFAYQQLNQMQKALDFAQRYMVVYNEAWSDYLMGKLYFDNRKYKDAKAYFLKVIDKNPKDFSSYLYLADICINYDIDFNHAKLLLDKAQSIDSSYSVIYMMFAMLSHKTGAPKEAKSYAQTAYKKAKTDFIKQEAKKLLDFLNSI